MDDFGRRVRIPGFNEPRIDLPQLGEVGPVRGIRIPYKSSTQTSPIAIGTSDIEGREGRTSSKEATRASG
ncbi:hypothetical protein ABZZ74_42695, partial [Streptomyces sp. NPDC006476]|uniref:hypothetical protein n=1 Tax=Streptomyces sp. NPDC006476 TaxID=3157175 RepID=UPI0033A93045